MSGPSTEGPVSGQANDNEPHEVPGVEYVPVCDRCWKPVQEHEELIDGRWQHAGFRHLDPELNPTTRPGALPEEDE